MRAHHKTSSNEDYRLFSPRSVLQSGQCHNNKDSGLLVRIQDSEEENSIAWQKIKGESRGLASTLKQSPMDAGH